MGDVNLFAVITTSILSIAVGVIWYSPMVFGRMWLRASQLDEEVVERQIVKKVVVGFIVQCVLFYALAYLLMSLRIYDASFFYKVLFLISLVAVLAGVGPLLWERKSCAYIGINISYMFVVLVLGGCVIMYWPW